MNRRRLAEQVGRVRDGDESDANGWRSGLRSGGERSGADCSRRSEKERRCGIFDKANKPRDLRCTRHSSRKRQKTSCRYESTLAVWLRVAMHRHREWTTGTGRPFRLGFDQQQQQQQQSARADTCPTRPAASATMDVLKAMYEHTTHMEEQGEETTKGAEWADHRGRAADRARSVGPTPLVTAVALCHCPTAR